MQEQRLTLRLIRYWELIRKNKRFPEINRFNAGAIEEIWPYCFRVGINSRGKRLAYTYEYMGEPIAELYGKDLTGLTVDHKITQFPGGVIHPRLQEVAEKQMPMGDDNHFLTQKGELIKYRACLLPFGTAKKGVTHIVVGLSCRRF